MAKPTLADVNTAVTDPLLSDNFQLEFANVPTGQGGSTSLLMQCKSASKPGFTINSVDVQLFGHTVKYAGNKTFSHEMSVSYVENRSLQIHNILEPWGELIRGTQTQTGSYKKDYARDGYLTVFDQKGEVVKKYVIQACWPSSVPEVSFDGTSSNIIDVSVTFTYDIYYDETTGIGR